jgi:hypothetical protein
MERETKWRGREGGKEGWMEGKTYQEPRSIKTIK